MIAMTQVLAPLLLLLLHAQLPPVSSVRRLVAEFQHGAGHNLSHLALDTSRGRIYVAGTNVLYQLDDALRVRHKVETGKLRLWTREEAFGYIFCTTDCSRIKLAKSKCSLGPVYRCLYHQES